MVLGCIYLLLTMSIIVFVWQTAMSNNNGTSGHLGVALIAIGVGSVPAFAGLCLLFRPLMEASWIGQLLVMTGPLWIAPYLLGALLLKTNRERLEALGERLLDGTGIWVIPVGLLSTFAGFIVNVSIYASG